MTAVKCIGLMATIVIIARCICVIYQTHWTTHRQGFIHWMGFGASYIAVACGALCGALFLMLSGELRALASVTLFLVGSSGLIAFDRRQPFCKFSDNCERRSGS